MATVLIVALKSLLSVHQVLPNQSSWFAYHIAKIGGFNFIAKEVETNPDNPISYYLVNNKNECPNFKLFLEDLQNLVYRNGSWVFPILGAVAASDRPSQFHFCYSAEKYEEGYENVNTTLKDTQQFEIMYRAFSKNFEELYQLKSDKNHYFTITSRNIAHFIKAENICTLRINTKLFVFDTKSIAYAKLISDIFNQYLETDLKKEIPKEMQSKNTALFGMQGYIDDM